MRIPLVGGEKWAQDVHAHTLHLGLRLVLLQWSVRVLGRPPLSRAGVTLVRSPNDSKMNRPHWAVQESHWWEVLVSPSLSHGPAGGLNSAFAEAPGAARHGGGPQEPASVDAGARSGWWGRATVNRGPWSQDPVEPLVVVGLGEDGILALVLSKLLGVDEFPSTLHTGCCWCWSRPWLRTATAGAQRLRSPLPGKMPLLPGQVAELPPLGLPSLWQDIITIENSEST